MTKQSFDNIISRFPAAPFGTPARPYLLLGLAVILVYMDVYPNTFLMDDIGLIVRNKFLTSWSYLPDLFTHLNYAGSRDNEGFYRPVPAVLHLILYQMFGPSTVAFHTLNIVFQIINAGLVYRLGQKLGFAAGAAFAAALLWGVHPLDIEAVTYMNATPEVLGVTFLLLSLLALLPDFTPRNTALAAVFFFLALGCKESSIVFPALAGVCLFLTSEDRLKPSIYIKTWPFWLMAVLYLAVYLTLNPFRQCEGNMSLDFAFYCGHISARIFTSLATLPVYLGLIVYPTGLHMERFFPVYRDLFSGQVLAGLVLVIAAALQIAWGKGRRGLPLSFGLLWAAIAVSPATGILAPADSLISEHWMYVPDIGLFLGVSQAVSNELNKSKIKQGLGAVAVVVAAFLFGLKTYNQNQVWLDPPVFYANVFEHGGYKRGLSDLGQYYLYKGQFDKAAETFHLALQNIDPNATPEAALHRALALSYLHIGLDSNYTITSNEISWAMPNVVNIPEGMAELNKAVEKDPDEYFSYGLLSALYKKQGNEAKADAYREKMQEAYKRKTGAALN